MQEQVPTARFITTFGGAISYAIAVTVMSLNIFLIFAEREYWDSETLASLLKIGDDACDIVIFLAYVFSLQSSLEHKHKNTIRKYVFNLKNKIQYNIETSPSPRNTASFTAMLYEESINVEP